MSIVTRLKSTKEIVVVLGRISADYIRVMLPPQAEGHSHRIEVVRASNLDFSGNN